MIAGLVLSFSFITLAGAVHYGAKKAYVVLGGEGTATVDVAQVPQYVR